MRGRTSQKKRGFGKNEKLNVELNASFVLHLLLRSNASDDRANVDDQSSFHFYRVLERLLRYPAHTGIIAARDANPIRGGKHMAPDLERLGAELPDVTWFALQHPGGQTCDVIVDTRHRRRLLASRVFVVHTTEATAEERDHLHEQANVLGRALEEMFREPFIVRFVVGWSQYPRAARMLATLVILDAGDHERQLRHDALVLRLEDVRAQMLKIARSADKSPTSQDVDQIVHERIVQLDGAKTKQQLRALQRSYFGGSTPWIATETSENTRRRARRRRRNLRDAAAIVADAVNVSLSRIAGRVLHPSVNRLPSWVHNRDVIFEVPQSGAPTDIAGWERRSTYSVAPSDEALAVWTEVTKVFGMNASGMGYAAIPMERSASESSNMAHVAQLVHRPSLVQLHLYDTPHAAFRALTDEHDGSHAMLAVVYIAGDEFINTRDRLAVKGLSRMHHAALMLLSQVVIYERS